MEKINMPLNNEWTIKLGETGEWQGREYEVIKAENVNDILSCVFDQILPIISTCKERELDIAFSDIQKEWGSEYLVESESDIIKDIINENLKLDLNIEGFRTFSVDIGTEADIDSKFYWLSRVNADDYKALCKVKYIQINSFFHTTFKGYRIWKRIDEYNNTHIALGAAGGSVLL